MERIKRGNRRPRNKERRAPARRLLSGAIVTWRLGIGWRGLAGHIARDRRRRRCERRDMVAPLLEALAPLGARDRFRVGVGTGCAPSVFLPASAPEHRTAAESKKEM